MNGTFRLASPTGMKMYGGFASDLWAVTDTARLIYGQSLLRQSVDYTFANVSIELVLVHNGTIPQRALSMGSFGRSVQSAEFGHQLQSIAFYNDIGYVPSIWYDQWDELNSVGGNVFCEELPGGDMRFDMCILSGAMTPCLDSLGEFIRPSAVASVLAVLATNLTRNSVNQGYPITICRNAPGLDLDSCVADLLAGPRNLLRSTTFFADPGLLIRRPPRPATAYSRLMCGTTALALLLLPAVSLDLTWDFIHFIVDGMIVAAMSQGSNTFMPHLTLWRFGWCTSSHSLSSKM
ncbi:hypothetical protein DYB35_006115 [Aphanomyces astaci]|uniref:Uncharacterized protein n=1 Tax=Aphanomyces astaci TaxID=112090 RepID=A0A418CJP3_APHAT|nr:hypothetical protein DYB35_006115 [Aphanomyces astaci]